MAKLVQGRTQGDNFALFEEGTRFDTEARFLTKDLFSFLINDIGGSGGFRNDKQLDAIGSNVKKGTTMQKIITGSTEFKDKAKQLRAQGGNPSDDFIFKNSQAWNKNFLMDQTARQVSAKDVDDIIGAFQTRQRTVKAREETGGKANSLLTGNLFR